MPDAIGFRAVSDVTETVVVEVKTSRSDFLADAKKPHRAAGAGLGLYRYFLCPEGLINPAEVPPRWGLLWVSSQGRITAKLGPVAESRNCGTFKAVAPAWQHTHDREREMWLLVRVMARIEDPNKIKDALNAATREGNRLAKVCEAQSAEIQQLRTPRPRQEADHDFAVSKPTAMPRQPRNMPTHLMGKPKCETDHQLLIELSKESTFGAARIQRLMGWGYNRAARKAEEMLESGLIKQTPSKPHLYFVTGSPTQHQSDP